jgi:DNA helicase HerA-like ATPase
MNDAHLATGHRTTCSAGHVISVSGSEVTGILDGDNAEASSAAEAMQIGGLVRLPTAGSDVFGMVNGLRVENSFTNGSSAERKIVEIQLLGEVLNPGAGGPERVFERGVSTYPSLDCEIFAASRTELELVYARPSSSNVRVGTIHQDRSLPAFLVTDDLLGKHFAILGTTGSGKSCAVAVILHAIMEEHPNGHIILLDPHNEYTHAFADVAEVISPNNLQLPYWLLNFEEIASVMVGRNGASRETETAILKGAILEAKKRYLGEAADTDHITVDTPTPYRLGELIRVIDGAMGTLDKAENSAPYLRLKSRIESLSSDKRFAFMFSKLIVRDNMVEVFARILRIPVSRKPITIIDISGVPSEIIDVVVSVLCHSIFDFALWSERSRALPVLLVCEEAHRYVPRDDDAAFGPTKRAISRIAREGRKYGVSLCLVSQRPSELSASILSQCNTLFALRMSNERDHNFVRNALPDGALGLLTSLPALRTQEAVVVGEGVTVPMRLRFDNLEPARRPMSGTACFSTAWQEDREQKGFVAETVERWRKQTR